MGLALDLFHRKLGQGDLSAVATSTNTKN
jgi:hypothetical protein